jgi:thioredoxin 2
MGALQADESGVIVTCPACDQKNRLTYPNLDRTPRCAKCKTQLTPPSEPIDIPSTAAFDALVGQSPLPVLVDFWAEWCGPCHMVAPEVARVASMQAGRLVVAKVDTEALMDVASRFGIRSIPTMALFEGGREVGRTMGARPAEGILAFVTQTLQQRVER